MGEYATADLVERDCPTDAWVSVAAALATGPAAGLIDALIRMGNAVAIAGGAVLAAEFGIPASDIDVFVGTAAAFHEVLAACGKADYYRTAKSGSPLVALHVAGCVPVQIILSKDATTGRAADVIRGFDLDYCQVALWVPPGGNGQPRILETRFAQEARRTRRVGWILDIPHNSMRLAARVRKAARKGFPLAHAVASLAHLDGVRFHHGATKRREDFDPRPRPVYDNNGLPVPPRALPVWHLSYTATEYFLREGEVLFEDLAAVLQSRRMDCFCETGYADATDERDEAPPLRRFIRVRGKEDAPLARTCALWRRLQQARLDTPNDRLVFRLWRVFREVGDEPNRDPKSALRNALRVAAGETTSAAVCFPEVYAADYKDALAWLDEDRLLDFVAKYVGCVP